MNVATFELRVEEAEKGIESWERVLKRLWTDAEEEGVVFLLSKGNMKPVECKITMVCTHNRVEIQRTDNGKRYCVGTYWLRGQTPSQGGEGRTE
jgi:hypothetical protein